MFRASCSFDMTPSRASAPKIHAVHVEPDGEAEAESERDTIPAPPPSAASLAGIADAGPPESRIESRRLDTIPAPAPLPTLPTFDEEPTTDRAPVQHDAV
jgi:hypothetical protein